MTRRADDRTALGMGRELGYPTVAKEDHTEQRILQTSRQAEGGAMINNICPLSSCSLGISKDRKYGVGPRESGIEGVTQNPKSEPAIS